MIYSLCYKATLDGCYALRLERGFDDPEHTYTFQLRCLVCGHNYRVSLKLRQVIPEGFKRQCFQCGTFITVDVITGFGKSYFDDPDSPGTPGVPEGYSEMMRFDISGAEPHDYEFGKNWEVTYYGKIFGGLDLSDKDNVIDLVTDNFTDFDEVEAAINPEPIGEYENPVDSDDDYSFITIRNHAAKFFKLEDLNQEEAMTWTVQRNA